MINLNHITNMEKVYYVYELINLYGTVEYVGMSVDPKVRFHQHTKLKPSKTSVARGKFLGRNDIVLNIVDGFNDIKSARDLEEILQREYGLIVDRDIKKQNMKASNILLNMNQEELKEHQTILANRRWNKNKLENNGSL